MAPSVNVTSAPGVPLKLIVAVSPEQMVVEPLIVAVGSGFTLCHSVANN